MIKKLQKIRTEKGFTLAELLIVILIIAILATLAIVFFSGQQDTAGENTAKGNIRSAYSAAQSYYVENNGSYPEPAGEPTAQDALVESMKGDGVDAVNGPLTGSDTPGQVGVALNNGDLTLTAPTGTSTKPLCQGRNATGPLVVTCS